ncbi:MAG TPA: VCBS repeat-containing protein [Candidatus Thermoplasmatota archaeon]|nr:VCBS repeat-containing protein [Candidatus Thermoplasmatota archaeon]
MDRTPSFWVTEHAASFPEAVFGIAVGDADRDGDAEAWATSGLDDHASLWRIEVAGDGYAAEQVAFSTAGGARDIVVGDGDNDGQVEAYVLNSAHPGVIQVIRFSFSGGVWTERRIDLGPGRPLGLDLADGDGDGKRELYVSDWDGRLIQAFWTGSAWAGAAVAQLGNGDFLQQVAIGDAEGDGKPDAYGFGVDPAAQPGTCCNPVTMHRFARVAAMPFDATFTGVRGNEWWIQVNVAAAGGTLAKVDVRLNGGDWKPLAKQSWGGYAASYRAVDGTIVQFRATSTTGATDLSDCYRWIPPSNTDATKVSCGTAPPPPPPPGFDATFSGVKGNEWWVQANVAGNQPIAKVEARVNCGTTWHTLTLQSWGGYAKSFHVPNGAKVDFRATSTTGATDMSGGYIWPQATPTGAC